MNPAIDYSTLLVLRHPDAPAEDFGGTDPTAPFSSVGAIDMSPPALNQNLIPAGAAYPAGVGQTEYNVYPLLVNLGIEGLGPWTLVAGSADKQLIVDGQGITLTSGQTYTVYVQTAEFFMLGTHGATVTAKLYRKF